MVPYKDSMPIIGAHVSAAGGLHTCFRNAEEIGAQALQIFGASPRQWSARQPTAAQVEEFKAEQKRSGLGPVFLHGAYLVNLGTPKQELWAKSVENLAAHLRIATAIGAQGVIFHVGSSNGSSKEEGMKRAAEGMKEVLQQVPGKTQLIMENAAGGGDKIGRDPQELGWLLQNVKSKRVKVCIDTQHTFAAGCVPVYNPKEIQAFVEVSDKAFGWENVVALHLNDSKTIAGSCHDRHENIGEGFIGSKGFKHLAQNASMKKLPWILEVPGFENQGPDKKNIDIVKKVVAAA